MKCAMCLGRLIDVGDGYECRECGYFLEYDEIDEYEDGYEVFEEYYGEYDEKYDEDYSYRENDLEDEFKIDND